jgi:NADP-dependent 3-hydroxy acid dehydrogenase YdfG
VSGLTAVVSGVSRLQGQLQSLLDVGTEAACLAFVNGAAQKFGRLDILINNAGTRKYEKVDEASAASWNEILDETGTRNVSIKHYLIGLQRVIVIMLKWYSSRKTPII